MNKKTLRKIVRRAIAERIKTTIPSIDELDIELDTELSPVETEIAYEIWEHETNAIAKRLRR